MKLVNIIKGLFLGAAIVLGVAQAQTDTSPVKFNPGHYIQLNGRAGDFLIENTFKEISALPNVRGVQTRHQWTQLEPEKGIYNFTPVDNALGYAVKYNKRLALFISAKAFTTGGKAVPDYMHTAEYSGGAYKIMIGAKDTMNTPDMEGENVALYDAKVRDRLIALMQALGKRYNGHNSLELIAFNETAMGQADPALTTAQKDAWFSNLRKVHEATRAAFPNTVVMQFVNFPRTHTPNLVSGMMENGTALGGPDTFLNAEDLETQTYPFYDTAQYKLAIGPSVQGENYVASYQFGPYVQQNPVDLYNFAKSRLHANYIFWNKTTDIDGYNPYNRVLNMFKSDSFPQGAAGGLRTACPDAYYSCVRKLP
jgi:hypothetical protein